MASAEQRQQVLIFVHSRKETAKTARYLKETALANDTLMKFMKVRASAFETMYIRGPTPIIFLLSHCRPVLVCNQAI